MTDSSTPWLDAHLDLAYMALDRDSARPSLKEEGDPSAMAITLPSLARGNVRCCLATIFTAAFEPEDPCGYTDHEDRAGAHQAGRRQVELYEAWEHQGLVRILRTHHELESCLEQENGPLGIVLLMECADPIRSPAEVAWWAERGVRMVGLSWAHGSRYSGGNHRGGGLTDEGRELVAALDEAGIAHDVSHLSDESMEDLLALAQGPIASSHSNARRLLPEGRGAMRHLHEDHAREIARRGGVAGVNLYGKFLARDRSATLEDVVEHANVLAEAFGRDRVGLGSDADGGFTPAELPEKLKQPVDYHRMTDALADSGWTPKELRGFSSTAWRAFLAKVPSMA
ncbi:MAG: peptidase M19 [Alphaproteobacteria bacterium TMED89]|nr:peptidase M19 [Rhodospirillaceae bacterium]RPH20099.1 MAG: peptidase M19 [Alphaproteobacteria bacterium TMED89]